MNTALGLLMQGSIAEVLSRNKEWFVFDSPASIQDLGVRETLVNDLFLKQVFQSGTCTMQGLAGTLKLTVGLIHTVFHRMKSLQMIEVKGMVGDDYSFTLTTAGKNAAQERLQV